MFSNICTHLKDLAQRLPFAVLVLAISGWTYESGAHSGKVAIAIPMANITVDGDLSDWPQGMAKYSLHDHKEQPSEDFSGFFQVGYNPGQSTVYVAFEVHDDSVIKSKERIRIDIDAQHGSIEADRYLHSRMFTLNQALENRSREPLRLRHKWKV